MFVFAYMCKVLLNVVKSGRVNTRPGDFAENSFFPFFSSCIKNDFHIDFGPSH